MKAVFFDLFFTLIVPQYQQVAEYDVLGISREEWEQYAEDKTLYNERAIGNVTKPRKIIEKIVETMPYKVTETQVDLILERRIERMRTALCNVDQSVLQMLAKLRTQGYKLCLLSNADAIDCMYWNDSPLHGLFDEAVFSCNVGMLKPDVTIYQNAMALLGVKPEECIFVGDGGSNELFGAKIVGMKTVFVEWFDQKNEEEIAKIIKYADERTSIVGEFHDLF